MNQEEKLFILYEDLLDKLYFNFNLDILTIDEALRLRLINKKIKLNIDKQISELVPTINAYAFNLIPNGCFVCKKIEDQVNLTYTSKQFINPLSQPYYASFINSCNNSRCCLSVCKSKFKIAKESNKVDLFCNEIFVNNNKELSLKIKRSNGKIQDNVSITHPNIIFKNNTVRVSWKENDEYNDIVEKSKCVYINDLLELNSHISLNKNIQKKNVFK